MYWDRSSRIGNKANVFFDLIYNKIAEAFMVKRCFEWLNTVYEREKERDGQTQNVDYYFINNIIV